MTATWGRGALLTGLLALGVPACGGTRPYIPNPGPYDRMTPATRVRAALARNAAEAGDWTQAASLLEELTAERPRNVPLATFLQDARIEVRARTLAEGDPELELQEARPRAVADVFLTDLEAAEAASSVVAWLLAARLAPTPAETRHLLDRAQDEDPGCIWIHYGEAWARSVEREYTQAASALDVALRIDGGHLPSLLLYAVLLANAGETGRAVDHYELWLDASRDSPFVSRADRAEATVDLATLALQRERPKKALELLSDVDEEDLDDRARLYLVRAAALEERSSYFEAWEAARRAGQLDPVGMLSLVHQAYLSMDHPRAFSSEADIWETFLARYEERNADDESTAVDFQSLLFLLNAETRLERLGQAAQRDAARMEGEGDER